MFEGRAAVDSIQLTRQEFEKYQKLILKLCGISVPDTKITLLSNRVRRRLRATNIESFQSYFDFLTSSSGKTELDGFLSAITTNETSFFRTQKHFDWLSTEFVDLQIARSKEVGSRRSIRIWSAACSTGEEPYSIALCLAENQHKLTSWKLEILGTDISEQALSQARAGLFATQTMDDIPLKLRTQYFQHDTAANAWKVKPALSEIVKFKRHNLMHPITEPAFDCIFIRNVLIYFNRASKETVIENLVKALAPRGFLVVGPSEGIFDMLGMLTKRSTFLYQKE